MGVPAHHSTTRHLALLTRFASEAGLGGPWRPDRPGLLGGAFVYDPFELYRNGTPDEGEYQVEVFRHPRNGPRPRRRSSHTRISRDPKERVRVASQQEALCAPMADAQVGWVAEVVTDRETARPPNDI